MMVRLLRGHWNWPPMESDPALFQTLAEKLLTPFIDGIDTAVACSGVTDSAATLQHELLSKEARTTTISLPLRMNEVFSFDSDGVEANRDARALLVCFHNRTLVSGGQAPAAAAAAAVNAVAVDEGIIFVKQIRQLDAACGIIGLIHAVLNADGMLGSTQSTNTKQLSESSPLGTWFNALPAEATANQRGCALAADARIRTVYAAQAARGQSRMPCSPYWALLGIVLMILWVVALIVVIAMSFERGFSFLFVYFIYSIVVVIVVLIGYAMYNYFGGPLPVELECHFVCLAERGGRVLLFDGTQESVKDIGASNVNGVTFAETGLTFVRDALLPTLAQPSRCAIIALTLGDI